MTDILEKKQIIETDAEQISLPGFVRLVKARKKLFYVVMPIVLVVAICILYSLPRYYTTQTSLAPEVENTSISGGALGSLASSFGIDLNNMQSSDAITPLLYPDLMNDNKFVVDLLRIQVKAIKEKLPPHTNYYTYLTMYKKKSWMEKSLESMSNLLSHEETAVKSLEKINPYMLTKKEDGIVKDVRNNIRIDIDKKSGMITVFATAQDPLICKILADSVSEKLKAFIIKYRTSKSQKDVEHYKKLMAESQAAYEKVRRQYASFADANNDVILESVKSKMEDMENDMQLKYNQYTAYNTQYQASIAKLREHTPVFTVLQGASVPVKPAGPKRMLSILGILAFSFFVLLAGIISKQLLKELK